LTHQVLFRSNGGVSLGPPKLIYMGWAAVLSSSMLLGSVHATTVLREDSLGANPILFEPNRGQASAEFKYVARGNSYSFGIANDSLSMNLRPESRDSKYAGRLRGSESVSVSIRLLGARKGAAGHGENGETSVSNYFIGSDTSKWITRIPNFRSVLFEGIYPQIDWRIYGNSRELEYDFIVAPRGEARRIRLAVDADSKVQVAPNGDLVVRKQGLTIRQGKPVAYQVDAYERREFIDCSYRLTAHRISFSLGRYNHDRPLTIDPTLKYSTYLGGSQGDYPQAIAVDSTGSVYVTGYTSSPDFPTASAAQPVNHHGNAFVTKFNASGNQLVYSTFLGGSGGEEARGITVDAGGNAYVAGWTFSTDFPTVSAYQGSNHSRGTPAQSSFLTKIGPAGDQLIYSTYLGGSGSLDAAFGVAIDEQDNAYIAGNTDSSDFPVLNPLQSQLKGRLSAYFAKFTPAGQLSFSSYLGGSAADTATGIAVHGGNVYVTGRTNSLDFPVANAYQSQNRAATGSTDTTAFVGEVAASGGTLVFSTFLGGSTSEEARAVHVDSQGNVYVVGWTCSMDFPTTVNAFQAVFPGDCSTRGPTPFVTKLSASGSSLVFSTFLGGSGGGIGIIGDYANSVAVDAQGDAFVAGSAQSTDFPLANALQSVQKGASLGASNGFLAELDATGHALVFSTYLGGSGSFGNMANHTNIPLGDTAQGVVVDMGGNIYVAGQTSSPDFSTFKPFQPANGSATTFGSATTGFVVKIATQSGAAPATPTSLTTGVNNGVVTLTWTAVSGASSYNVYEGAASGQEASAPVETVYDGTSNSISGLSQGKTYFFVVTAVNENGESPNSAESSATIPGATSGGGGSGGGGGGGSLGLEEVVILLLAWSSQIAFRSGWNNRQRS
jgi:hypothetical protein